MLFFFRLKFFCGAGVVLTEIKMERRSWIWHSKSSGETESFESMSSHSEILSDDQVPGFFGYHLTFLTAILYFIIFVSIIGSCCVCLGFCEFCYVLF